MNKNRLLYITVALALAVILLLTVRTVVATNSVVAQGRDLSDYALRHLNPINANAAGASDWFQRHPESLNTKVAKDTSDYFQRHLEIMHSENAVDMSDYFLRHPISSH